tara:strand:+ start:434 stop:1420 length:987 start_codon:yes stop_codon:yes gene_type:complete
MATITLVSNLTLMELAKRHVNAVLQDIAEVLAYTNEIFMDMAWLPANGLTSHIFTQRAAEPAGAWRAVNEGIAASASQTQQVVEGIGLLEARSEIDEYLVGLADNPNKFRYEEDIAFVEGLGKTMLTAFFYGILASAPKALNGLATRYASHTNDSNVRSAGGSNSVSSAYLIQWGPKYCHMIYPKNIRTTGSAPQSDANIVSMNNLGKQLVSDGTNNFVALVTQFVMNAGIAIHDNRCVQRLSNLDLDMSPGFSPDEAIKCINSMFNRGKGAFMYLNKNTMSDLDIIAKEDTNVVYRPSEAFGVPTTYFRGIPVRICESITNSETATT